MSAEIWFEKWLKLMSSSSSFRRLLEDCILPILKRQTLLAFPEDARLRDKFACVFSLEVLRSIEGAEGPLQSYFEKERKTSSNVVLSEGDDFESYKSSSAIDVDLSVIMKVLKRINLVPTVINGPQVAQLIRDVMPEEASKRSAKPLLNENHSSLPFQLSGKSFLLFPQWEWVVSVVAFQAVETAIAQSTIYTNPNKIPSLVAGVIISIASAIAQFK
jgi:hypothetical protein